MLEKFRAYSRSSRESLEAYREIFGLLDTKSIVLCKRMMVWLVVSVVFTMVAPLIVERVASSAIRLDAYWVYAWLGVYTLLASGKHYCNWRRRDIRELLLGVNRRSITEETSERFLARSVGDHITDGTVRGESAIRKGKDKLIAIEDMILFMGVSVFLEFSLAFIFLFIYNYVVGLAMLCLILIHTALSIYINHKILYESDIVEEDWRKLDSYIHERLKKVIMVKLFAKEADEVQFIRKWYDDILRRDYTLWRWVSKVNTIRDFIGNLFVVVAMFIVIQTVLVSPTPGLGIAALFPIYLWSHTLVGHTWALADVERMIQASAPAVRLMVAEMKKERSIVDADNAHIFEHGPVDIVFDNLSYTYVDRAGVEVPVLRDISLRIPYGKKVALVAPSGTGKSTLVSLLMRSMDPTVGSIYLEYAGRSVDLRDVKQASWLQQIGYIPQHIDLFDGTIEYNLRYGCTHEPSRDELQSVMERCQITQHDGRLNEGLDTYIGDKQLSGGQQQLIAWCRAFLKDPSVIVLDEATSNIDAHTEKLLTDQVDDLCAGRTAIIIAHRLKTIRDCDMVVVLKPLGGLACDESQIDVIADSFDEAIEQSELFARLCRHQDIGITV